MEGTTKYMSLRQAAREIGEDPRWLKGHLAALGIEPIPMGAALVISDADLARVRIGVIKNSSRKPKD